MKMSAYIALAAFLVLTSLYFLLYEKPATTVESAVAIEAVEHPSRVEIVAPSGADLIVLEADEGTWRITRPVEAELAPAAQTRLGELFAEEVRADDIELSADKLADYQLDEASAVSLSVYGADRESPSVQLEVGKELVIPQTRVRRTYVRRPGTDKPHRAQIALGDFVRQSVSELRSKSMLQLDREAILEVRVLDHGDPSYQLVRQDEQWTLADADGDQRLDEGQVSALIRRLSRIRAVGFAQADDADTQLVSAEGGPKTSVEILTEDATHTVAIGAENDDGEVFTRVDKGPIFTLRHMIAGRLAPPLDDLLADEDDGADDESDEAAPEPPAPESSR